jgi:hypothetical protein
LLAGEEDLSSWDDEEIQRGQRRSKNGSFVGRPPKVIPQAVHEEWVRRTMRKAYTLLKESTYDAAKLLRQIVNDEEAPYGFRLRAAELIFERVLGKATEKVELSISDEPPWVRALQGAITGGIDRSGLHDEDIIDAEVVEFE